MPSNFPVIQGLLQEFVQDDIASGLKKILSNLRGDWKTGRTRLERMQKTAWKKLNPAQKQAMRQTLVQTKNTVIKKPAYVPQTGPIIDLVNSVDEAAFLLIAMQTMAVAISDIDANFLRNAKAIITPEEFELFQKQAGTYNELPFGPAFQSFIQEHYAIFENMFEFTEDLLIDVDRVSAELRNALLQTKNTDEERNQKKAAVSVHYFLHRLKVTIHELFDALERDLRGRNLVKGDRTAGFETETGMKLTNPEVIAATGKEVGRAAGEAAR